MSATSETATPAAPARAPVVDPGHPVDYASNGTPPTYVCGTCHASDCKLWRNYQTFLSNQSLYCARCAGKEQDIDVSAMDAEGRRPSRHGGRTDQIGWLVPAVPTQENDTFWGYSSVPGKGVEWWRRLPTFATQ